MKLKNRRFVTTEEIQKASQTALQAVTESVFKKLFQQWKKD